MLEGGGGGISGPCCYTTIQFYGKPHEMDARRRRMNIPARSLHSLIQCCPELPFLCWQECPESHHRSSTARRNRHLLYPPRPPRWELADEAGRCYNPVGRIATCTSRWTKFSRRDRLLPWEVVRHHQGAYYCTSSWSTFFFPPSNYCAWTPMIVVV